MLYFTWKHIMYLMEVKEENSSNTILITVNPNLYFEIWLPSNLLFRLYCKVTSWNRLALPEEEHIYCISDIWVLQ